MRILNIAAAVAAVSMAATQAGAATFSFVNASPDTPTYTDTQDGITLDVSAGSFEDDSLDENSNFPSGTVATGTVNPGSPNNSAFLTFTGNGLGVFGGSDPNGPDSDRQIDGRFTLNDLAIFDFGEMVILDEIDFNLVGGNDDFVLFAGNSLADLTSFTIFDIPGNAGNIFSSGAVGRYFGIGAFETNDEFRIKSLTVSEVPLPAALPLFIAGLAGLRFAGRRKKANV